MRTLNQKFLQMLAFAFVLGASPLFACDGEGEENAAEEIGDAAEMAADEVEEAAEDFGDAVD